MMSSPSRHPEKGMICVVDDDLPTLKSLVRLLDALELQTVPFENPRLFLEYVKDHSVSLAIVDLRMPELSGLDVQRALCDICPGVPVVIITGEREPGIDRTIALDQGAIAFLFKPLAASELLKTIRKVLPAPSG
jgi:FixJ family two-component response regulator